MTDAKAFRLTIPPGFLRLALPLTSDEPVRRYVLTALRTAPDSSKAQIAGGVHSMLMNMCATLGDEGWASVYIAMPGTLMSAVQPILTHRSWITPEGVDPFAALCVMAEADKSAELLDVDPAVCLRTHVATMRNVEEAKSNVRDMADVAVDEQLVADIEMMNVQVNYHLGVPGEFTSWYQFTGVATIAQVASMETHEKTVLELFDGIVRTFEWVEDA